MSNLIPPLVSSSPPPMVTDEPDDLEDDEFGDFTAAADLSFEGYSLPTTPQHASFSNYTSNSLQTQSNLIISPKMKNRLDTKVSENIFCDIKDVNTIFVNNKISDEIKDSIDSEVFVPRINETHDSLNIVENNEITHVKETQEDDFGDFDSFPSNDSRKNQESNSSNINLGAESNLNEFIEAIIDENIIKTQENVPFNTKQSIIQSNTESGSENSETVKKVLEVADSDDFFEFESTTDRLELNKLENHANNYPSSIVQSTQNNLEEINEEISLENDQTIEVCRRTNDESAEEIEEIKLTSEEDFGEFNSTVTENEISSKKIEDSVDRERIKSEDSIFDYNFKREVILRETRIGTENVDDFGDFTSEEIQDVALEIESTDLKQKAFSTQDDEFGDFNDYTKEIEFPTNFDMSPIESVENAEKVIKDLFIDQKTDLPDTQIVNFVENSIFKQLHDIENTSAFSYQWATSESQKMMLKALNIDSRNILFGPRWNASMPRFAANLGFAPLEPIKSELPALGGAVTSPSVPLTPEPVNCDIPAAKFDWTSSGLVNPLDSQSTDIKQAPVEDKLMNQSEPKRPFESSGPIPLDLSILNNFGSDNESVNSLKFIETPADIDNEIKLETGIDNDFSGFQSSKSLKESKTNSTYEPIENKSQILNIQQIELESTIVTPELSRKSVNIEEAEDDDDFTDFQMSLPQEPKLKSELSGSVPIETNQKGDFVASVPLEPLKPIVLEPSVISKTPTQINWPEPGIISENINEFEFTYTGTKNLVQEKSEATAEEEDWSDFVCVQRPETNKTQNFNMSNNLELSVPDLENTHLTNKASFIPNSSPTKTLQQQQMGFNYQPPYQISLQTINTPFGGLPQTSLSTYNNFTTELSQNVPTKNSSTNIGIFDGPFNPEINSFQPYNQPNSVDQSIQAKFQSPVQSVESTFLKMQQPSKEFLNSKEDDDDWSDFVSSQPINLNGFGQQKQSNNFNIIANPVHFDAFHLQSSSDKNRKPTNSIPSISALPELDFIAPKNKFFSKK